MTLLLCWRWAQRVAKGFGAIEGCLDLAGAKGVFLNYSRAILIMLYRFAVDHDSGVRSSFANSAISMCSWLANSTACADRLLR